MKTLRNILITASLAAACLAPPAQQVVAHDSPAFTTVPYVVTYNALTLAPRAAVKAQIVNTPTGPYVHLSWAASASTGVTYNPYRAAVANGTACPSALSSYTQLTTGVSGTTFDDSTATSVGLYCYVVTAAGGGFESAPSNSASATVLPQPPSALTATSH